ncbi:kelch domain-containing protein 10 homolog isoform X2 [Microplitis demolitor]|nr:kelch domain-containing protein 10 homolog isoform X2 [Microplitis demolitor]
MHSKNISCDGKNVYIYQREYVSDLEFNNIWVYNLAGKQWKLIRNASNSLDNTYPIGTIFESNYLIICTIRVPFNDNLSSRKCRLYIYDSKIGGGLVRETSGQIPSPSFPLNLIRHGKYLYTVGATNDLEAFSDVYRLNIENGVWEIVYICKGHDENEPLGRSDHTLVYDNNMIYIFGGDCHDPEQDDAFTFVKISAFDLEKYCWKIVDTRGDENNIPQYPVEREGLSATSYTDPDSGEINVIISGGRVYSDDTFSDVMNDGFYENLNDVWSLNLTSLKWTCLKRFGTVLPHYVENHSMAISPAGKLFTFGGNIFSTNVEERIRFSSLHSAWLRIPKLTDICWEAVFHYYPNLKSMTDKELCSLGIPLLLLKSRIN